MQSTLNLPANNATGVSLSPNLSWTPVCTPDSFRVQIALDTFFTGVIIDQAAITTTNYNVLPGLLNTGTKYFWRVYGVNAAGVGKWSTINSFTTLSVLPVTFISFDGYFDNAASYGIHLHWVTANETNTHRFIIERSNQNSIAFDSIGLLPALQQQSTNHSYYFTDKNPLVGQRNLYRIKQVDADGKFQYSKMINIATIKSQPEELIVYPNPVTDFCTLQVPAYMHACSAMFINAAGAVVLQFNNVKNDGTGIKIDLRKFPAGFYYIQVQESGVQGTIFTQKVEIK